MELSQINAPMIVAITVFLAISLFVLGITIFLRQNRQRREMLSKIKNGDDTWLVTEPESLPSNLSGTDIADKSGMAKLLDKIGKKANPGRSIDDVDVKLKFLRAGVRDRNAATVFWGTKFMLGISFAISFGAFVIFSKPGMPVLHVALLSMGLGIIGLFLPDYWLWKKAINRRNRIVKGFPDALDMLVVCVEAGMGLDAAINRVGLELELSQPDLSEEFKFLNLELRAGKARSAALRSMGDRINADDVNSLVTLLLQTDRFGTSVGQALRVYSDSFRTKRQQRAEEIAAKLSTKLIFPMATCIFPAMFTVLLGPAAIQIYRVLFKIT
jgi:tight adherence protein C